MRSEKSIQEGLQSAIRTLTEYFEPEGVGINTFDWLFDTSIYYSPFFIIGNSDDWRSQQDAKSNTGFWYVPGTLVVEFRRWEESLNLFRDVREAILTYFDGENTSRTAGGLEGVNIRRIRPVNNIDYIGPESESGEQVLPVYITQTFIFEVELF